MPILKDLEAFEVSLVKRGANRRKFLLLKSDQEEEMDTIVKSLLEKGTKDDEAKLQKIMKSLPQELKKEDAEKAAAALLGAKKLVDAAVSELPEADQAKAMETAADVLDLGGMGWLGLGLAAAEHGEHEEEEEIAAAEHEDKDKHEMKKSEDGMAGKKKDETPSNAEAEAKAEAIWKEREKVMVAKQEELETKLEEEKTLRIKKEFVEKAGEFKHISVDKVDLAETLRLVQKNAPDQYEDVEKILKSADAAIAKGELFSERGSNQGSAGGSTWTKIQKAADAQKLEGESSAQAVDRYIQTDEGKKLYEAYNNGEVQ